MDAFKRGWSFLRQSWDMVRHDGDLIKPSIYALFAGILLSLLTALPFLAFSLFLSDKNGLGMAFWVLLGAALAFVEYMTAYVFSAMTVYLIYGYLAEGDGRMDAAWRIVRRDVWDLATLAAASALVSVVKRMVRQGKGARGARQMLSGLLGALWDEAAALLLPAMVIEDIPMMEAAERVQQIVKDHLPLVGLSTVGVKAATRLIGFLLGLLGLALGALALWLMYLVTGGATSGWVLGGAVAVLLFALMMMLAAVIGTYTRTAYHTCLYLWARDVERAKLDGHAVDAIQAPAPLAAVLQG